MSRNRRCSCQVFDGNRRQVGQRLVLMSKSDRTASATSGQSSLLLVEFTHSWMCFVSQSDLASVANKYLRKEGRTPKYFCKKGSSPISTVRELPPFSFSFWRKKCSYSGAIFKHESSARVFSNKCLVKSSRPVSAGGSSGASSTLSW